MTTRAVRRMTNTGALLVALATFFSLWERLAPSSYDPRAFSGWSLLGLVGLLSLYAVKKRVPIVPAGPSSAWLQFHVYAGLFTLAVFLAHVGVGRVTGILETALGLLFAAVFASGCLGLVLMRTLPRRIAAMGNEVIYERIPSARVAIVHEADEIVTRSIAETKSDSIASFYLSSIRGFLDRPCSLRLLLPGARDADGWRADEIRRRARYMTATEQVVLAELATLVRRKTELDHQEAAQFVLKYWLFFHVSATGALLVVAPAHGIIASVFAGGIG